MSRFLIWAAPLLVAATPAFAQEAATAIAAPAPAAAAAPAKPKKICRTQQITGRRISQSRCYTAAQWADYDRTQSEAAKRFIGDISFAGARNSSTGESSASVNTDSLFGLGPPR